jgi:type VI secretion system protein ImpH
VASEKRLADDLVAISEALAEAAPKAGFFPLVAFLERLTAGAQPLGGDGPASEEGIRFRHDPAMTFSAGDVTRVGLREERIRPGDPGSPTRKLFEVVTTFLGLTGSVTPLPLYVAEEVMKEAAEEERAVRRDFLDVFHHRMLSLVYRIRSRYDLGSGFRSGGEDRWSKRLLALGGMPQQPAGSLLPAWRLLRLAPLLSTRARTALGLEAFLGDVLEGDLGQGRVRIRQFAGAWADLEVGQRFQLGRANHALGKMAVLGTRVYFRAGSFAIRLGPLDERTYRRFLVDGDLHPVVQEAVLTYLADPLEYTLELELAEEAGKGFQLSARRDGGAGRLGRDTWLTGKGATQKQLKVARAAPGASS